MKGRTLPRVTTEIGIDFPDMSEETQAKLYLNLYLSQFANGYANTGLYLLKGRENEPAHEIFAFYKLDYAPKQAAHLMHNFTSVLDDRRPVAAADFKPLAYAVPDMPPTSHDLLLQRSDGNRILILWGERFASGGADELTVKLAEKARCVLAYDPACGVAAQKTYADADAIPVSLSDHPVILEIVD